MKGIKKKAFRMSAYVALGTSAVLALVNACGMCEGSGAAAVLAVAFEVLALVCLWISGGCR